MKYINIKDLSSLLRDLQQVQDKSQDEYIRYEDIAKSITTAKSKIINIPKIQYLEDAIKAIDKAIQQDSSSNRTMTRLSKEMEEIGFRVSRQTIAKWIKSGNRMGYNVANYSWNIIMREFSIYNLKSFMERLLNDEKRG